MKLRMGKTARLALMIFTSGNSEKLTTESNLGRSGFLDASTFLEQAEMWLQPESYAKFHRFYRLQINENDRYGCHCQLKDLVSQDYIDYQNGRDHFQYFGQPVDPLDKACHAHRECLRCARMELNCADDGISEHYLDYKLNKVGYCTDQEGTCERAYCECAKQFIVDIHNSAIYGYDEKYSRVMSGFKANTSTCPQVPSTISDTTTSENSERGISNAQRGKPERRNLACCSKTATPAGPWRLYNHDRYKCCSDGEVRIQC